MDGPGGSVAHVTALRVVARRRPGERLGLLGAVATIGTATASSTLPDVVDEPAWRIVFAATMAVGLAVLPGAVAFPQRDRPRAGAHGEGARGRGCSRSRAPSACP